MKKILAALVAAFFYVSMLPSIGAMNWTYTDNVTVQKTLISNDVITKGPWIDLRSYSATGDGVTDDSSFLLAAVAAADNGSTVMVPIGTFILDDITLTKDIHFVGISRTGSVLKHKASSTANMISTAYNVSFSNLTIDGNKDNITAFKSTIYFDGTSANLDVQNVDFQNTKRAGVEGVTVNGRFVVAWSKFTGMAEWGGATGQGTMAVYISGTGNTGQVDLSHNDVIGSAPTGGDAYAPGGFQVVNAYDNTSSMTISNNYFYRIGQKTTVTEYIEPISSYGQFHYTSITGNRIVSSYYTPIKIKNCVNPVVVGNNIYSQGWDFGADAIYLSGYDSALGTPPGVASGANISANIIDGITAGFGITVLGVTTGAKENENALLAANLINGCKGGVQVASSKNVSLEGNMITKSTGTTVTHPGILLLDVLGGINIHGGIIRGGDSYGVLGLAFGGATATDISIKDVYFDSNTNQHIYLVPASGTITSLDVTSNKFTGGIEPLYAVATTVSAFNNVSDSLVNTHISATAYHHSGNSWDFVVSTPASSSASCTTGNTAFDNTYFYQCYATDSWGRATLETSFP